jgi:MbtH protein
MMSDNDETLYRVVINHEEQYSIWPVGRPMPGGWTAVDDQRRTRPAAVAYIREVSGTRPVRIG